jgi:two-component system, NtrC family, nitrogen regulation sensor histidine kinase NtrY
MNKKNKTTFRFPFDIDSRIFMGLSIAFFILSISQVNQFFFPALSLDKLKSKIEIDLNQKLASFNADTSLQNLIVKASNNVLSVPEIETLNKLDFGIQIYRDDAIKFWSSSQSSILHDTFKHNIPVSFKDNYGRYIVIRKNITDANIHAIFSIPVKYENKLSNEYFKNYFQVDDHENDFGISLFDTPQSRLDLPILLQGKTMFYLSRENDFATINDSDGWRLFFQALPFILFGISVHTFFKVTTNKKVALSRFMFMLIFTLLIRGLNYYFSFPDDYSNYSLFRPEFYASDFLNRSLGDVFINMSLSFWLLLFFLINVVGNFEEDSFLSNSKVYKLIISFVFMLGQVYFFAVIRSIIHDSVIDFDFTNFSELSIFSILGLLTICIAIGNLALISFIAANYFRMAFANIFCKYCLILPVLFLSYFFIKPSLNIQFHLFCGGSIILFFLIHDFLVPKIKFDFNSYLLLLALIFTAAYFACIINIAIQAKEKESRMEFASKLLDRNNVRVEDRLQMIESDLLSDSSFLSSTIFKHQLQSLNVSKSIFQNYFLKTLSTYRCETYLYNLYGDCVSSLAVDDKENKKLYLLKNKNSKLKLNRAFQTSTKMRFSENPLGSLIFEICANNLVIGYLSIEVTDYFHLNRKVRSSFVDGNTFSLTAQKNYSYAIYDNKILNRVNGDFVFPYFIPNLDFNKNALSKIVKADERNILWLKDEFSETYVAIAHVENGFYLLTTLFAYIFFSFFAVITLYILANVIARSNLSYSRFINLLSLNLRLRLHFAILFVVVISFVSIGYFTYFILVNRIENRANGELKVTSQNIQDELNNQIKNIHFNRSSLQIDPSNEIQHIISLFKQVKFQFNKDISVFDLQTGDLIYTSQTDLYQSGLLKSKIDFELLHDAKLNRMDNMYNDENIGNYTYSSVYSNLRNQSGKIIGLMQIPSLSGKFDVQNEKNTIIITLVNIYVFVFLISALLALIISNSVTRPFRFVVRQFAKINLSQTNKPLKWNSNDEIGLLVKEYNRTLRKLENSTVMLAKSERELAWREMAKQVAHEIKNPLTPMKLSVQLLQRALKNDSPNVKETTERVTKTLLEQIDVLTEIATNFSSFARMPGDSLASVSLSEILYSVTGMYNDNYEYEFLFLIPLEKIYVTVDRAQLIRVFTNIIQNAIQSIPSGRKGNISLTVEKRNQHIVRISIMDNGEGISAEKARRLFEPYFTTKSSGTGLGLAMCKDMIESFGGEISFASAIGEGSTFKIDLKMDEVQHL